MGWTENTMEGYAKINTTRNKFESRILCEIQLKKVWERNPMLPQFKGYKGFGPADLRILYEEKILRGGEVMRNQLYQQNCTDGSSFPLSYNLH